MTIDIFKNQKIIVLGVGGIGKAVIKYIDDFFKIDYTTSLFIVEMDAKQSEFPSVKNAIVRGAKFINIELTNTNLNEIFNKMIGVNKYDIVIDVTTRTNSFEIFKFIRHAGLLYINTSIEDNRVDTKHDTYMEQTIYFQHLNLKNLEQKLKGTDNVTTLFEFGANPGLISIFVKHGIKKLAKQVIEYQIEHGTVNRELFEALQLRQFNKMAKILDIKVIHCSEIDTQESLHSTISPTPTMMNTWSCLGLIDEGVEPSEIVLGTHEDMKEISKNKWVTCNYFEQLLVINYPGYLTKFRSVVPKKMCKDGQVKFCEIEGRCIHHGEGISLNRYLSDDEYSPTIHYVYRLSPAVTELLERSTPEDLIKIGKGQQDKDWHVMNVYQDNLEGYDNLGALFIFDKNPFTGVKESYMYWTGSILHTDYCKNVLKDDFFGPTVIQVIAGIFAGLSYILENKHLGLVFGEDIDEKYVIDMIKDYLGNFYSGPVPSSLKLPVKLEELLIKKELPPTELDDNSVSRSNQGVKFEKSRIIQKK